jgi:hypothetical protein
MTAPRNVGVIFKYSIPVDGTKHAVPWTVGDTEVTGVEVQATDPGVVYMWVLHPCGVEAEQGERQFSIIGTGQPFDTDNAMVYGTTRHPVSQLVWHVIGWLS